MRKLSLIWMICGALLFGFCHCGYANEKTTFTVSFEEGLALIEGGFEELSQLKKELSKKGKLTKAGLSVVLKQKNLLGHTRFFNPYSPSQDESAGQRDRSMTVREAEEKGVLPVLREGLSSEQYFERLRQLGFSPKFAQKKPDPLQEILPQDICLLSATFWTENTASIRIAGQEIWKLELPFGFYTATLPPGESNWTVKGIDTFSPGNHQVYADYLNGLSKGTVFAIVAHGTTHRNVGSPGVQALTGLGSKLSMAQVGSDQTVNAQALVGVVGKPELTREIINADETVRLCVHGKDSFFEFSDFSSDGLPLPLIIFQGLEPESSLWFIDSPEDSLPSLR